MPKQPDDVDARLTTLEVKLAFAEDHVERLDALVVRQQRQIELLIREIARLREQMATSDPQAPRSLRDELPPHW